MYKQIDRRNLAKEIHQNSVAKRRFGEEQSFINHIVDEFRVSIGIGLEQPLMDFPVGAPIESYRRIYFIHELAEIYINLLDFAACFGRIEYIFKYIKKRAFIKMIENFKGVDFNDGVLQVVNHIRLYGFSEHSYLLSRIEALSLAYDFDLLGCIEAGLKRRRLTPRQTADTKSKLNTL